MIIEFLITSGKFDHAIIAKQYAANGCIKVRMHRTNDIQEIREAAGSQYLFADNWGEIFKFLTNNPEARLVIIAPPCMVDKLRSLSGNLFLVSFCCDNAYDDKLLASNIKQRYQVDADIESVRFRSGHPWPRFNLVINTSETNLIASDYYDELYGVGVMARYGCQTCTTYVAVADLLAADPWNLLTYSESTVLFQSANGGQLLAQLEAEGYLSRWRIAEKEFTYAHRYSFAAKSIKQATGQATKSRPTSLAQRLLKSDWVKSRLMTGSFLPGLLLKFSQQRLRSKVRRHARGRPDLRVTMIAYTRNNKGTEALTKSIIQLFREFARLNGKSISFSVISEQDPGVSPYFEGSLFTTENPLHPWLPFNRSVRQVLRTLKHYWLSDVVVHSGGDMLTGDAVVRLTNLVVPLILRKKVIILSETLGPYRTPGRRGWITRLLAKKLFSGASYLSSRDDDSIKFITELGIERDIDKTPDLAFLINKLVKTEHAASLQKQKIPLIGFNLNLDLASGFPGGLDALISQLVIFFNETFEALDGQCRFVLFSHVFHQTPDGLGIDGLLAEMIRKQYTEDEFTEKFLVHDHNLEFEQLRASVACLDLVISSRMHLCVSALSQQIPVIPIANNHKYKSVIGDINGIHYLIDIDRLTGERLTDLTLELFENRAAQVDLIKRNLERLEQAKTEFKHAFFAELNKICF